MTEECQTTHTILREALRCTSGPCTVHSQLGASTTSQSNPRIRAPPPQQVVALLRNEVAAGAQVGHVLDLVSFARAANSVRESSLETYLSHLRSVVAVCDLLKDPVVPASTRTIRLYTAICNNPVTLRGHLAAWKLLLVVRRCVRSCGAGGLTTYATAFTDTYGDPQGLGIEDSNSLLHFHCLTVQDLRGNGFSIPLRSTDTFGTFTSMVPQPARSRWQRVDLRADQTQEPFYPFIVTPHVRVSK